MPEDAGPYWLLRHPDGLLVETLADGCELPRGQAGDFPGLKNALAIGRWRGQPCHAAEIDTDAVSAPFQKVRLREIAGLLGMEGFALAGRGVQLLDWQRHHRYCGACATATQRLPEEFAMQCPACGLVVYPRLSPAVMVLVRRGDELLLARSAGFPGGVFSALAGFVEPGETLEECAMREVREEVGIEIANLRYFGSQPWPFPNSLMVAFFADHAAGDLRPDGREIEVAAWFSRDALPTLPMPMSIAHRLIAAALA